MLQLRDYMRAGAIPPPAAVRQRRTVAIVAAVAVATGSTKDPISPPAHVASAAPAQPNPEAWLAWLRSGGPACLTPERWAVAADGLESLMRSGVLDTALALGWDGLELVGVRRQSPHDGPSQAGLIWSLGVDDSVIDVRETGAIIAYGRVRHIWRRVPLPVDGSLVPPWDLPGARPLPETDHWES